MFFSLNVQLRLQEEVRSGGSWSSGVVGLTGAALSWSHKDRTVVSLCWSLLLHRSEPRLRANVLACCVLMFTTKIKQSTSGQSVSMNVVKLALTFSMTAKS